MTASNAKVSASTRLGSATSPPDPLSVAHPTRNGLHSGVPELRQSLPSWVETDPLRGRAVDALGLQATADRIADEILPDLSVLTNRARYFAVLAWARKVCGTHADEDRIHALESRSRCASG
jgi:hypothetical protein